MADRKAVAIDWNGKRIEVTFKSNGDMQKLANAAHAAFHRKGKWTIELRTVDGIEVPVELRYHA